MASNPTLNGRYHLVEQIGSGGMAVLYKAEDADLQRTVAVKVLRPSLVNDPEFVERFKREARSAANMSHPNIVTVHDVGQDGSQTHYIIMEYVPGQNLKQLIKARGAFEIDAALAIIIEVCKGVGYAHRAGLVHCDIKPQNILVTPDRRIKVVDFGIARALTAAEDGERESIVWGSPSYFAPEQAAGEVPTPASDVYAIGVVLFELLTGRLPFIGNNYQDLALQHIHDAPPSIHQFNPTVPDELVRIVEQTLAKVPSRRYRTADQLGRILQKYYEQGQQPTSSFQVTQSDVEPPPARDTPPPPLPPYPDASPPPQPQPRQEGRPEYTVPTLPPIPRSSAGERAAAESPSRAPVSYPRQPISTEREEAPGPDLYGIVLGVFAALLIVGLIPLWIAVFVTLTQ
ncbi:MAG: protein kinase [Anaerolineae bacterium]